MPIFDISGPRKNTEELTEPKNTTPIIGMTFFLSEPRPRALNEAREYVIAGTELNEVSDMAKENQTHTPRMSFDWDGKISTRTRGRSRSLIPRCVCRKRFLT